MDMSGIGLTPFYPGKCRLEIRQVGSELGVSTVNPESEGLGQLCVQSAPPLQAAGKGCLLRPTGRILRLKGQGFNSPRLQILDFVIFTLREVQKWQRNWQHVSRCRPQKTGLDTLSAKCS